jgi:glutamine synthetase
VSSDPVSSKSVSSKSVSSKSVAAARAASIGQSDFIARHDLWDDEQREAAARLLATAGDGSLRAVRVSVGDPHGKLRGKTILADAFASVLRNGVDFSTAIFHFDSADAIVYNAFERGGGLGMEEMSGFPDVVLVPDPTTFRMLPWAPGTGWCLGDLYFNDGRPVPFDSRQVLRHALAELAARGYDYLAGLEVEFYITRIVDGSFDLDSLGGPGTPGRPPLVTAVAPGYAYQSEDHQDQIEAILGPLADAIVAVGLPLRTMEDEWGPGQCEFTFQPLAGLAGADAMLLFRTAVRQVCRRLGFHATFMCKPKLPSFYASGWHLHQSLVARDTGANAFVAPLGSDLPISAAGRHFVGGLLAHAGPGSIFTTPTVNGYRRRKPFSLAPDRSTWGYDNRAAMIRVQGGPGDPGTHIENRIGEPAANPYLYLASQIVAGIDGMDRQIDPGPMEDEPYTATDRALLPATLFEAVAETRGSALYRKAFGDAFVDWYLGLKESELARFAAAEPDWASSPDDVTTWEHHEYFNQY